MDKDLLKSQIQTSRIELSDALRQFMMKIASNTTRYGLVVLGGVFVLILVNAALNRLQYRILKSKILKQSGNQDIVVVQAKLSGVMSLFKWHISNFLLGLAKVELEKLLARLTSMNIRR